MNANEKILEIDRILRKYGFNLGTTNLTLLSLDNKNDIYKELSNKTISDVEKLFLNNVNCIKEIMRVLYNVEVIEK